MIGGVNYYTGQLHDMKAITAAAHRVGAMCGFDLAHAMGNVHLDLHKWGSTLRAGAATSTSTQALAPSPACSSTSAMCATPTDTAQPRDGLEGWWGHDAESRFKMDPEFVPMPSAEAWQMSNAPVLNMAVHKVSLDLFLEAGMEALVARSKRLTAYLETLVHIVAERTDGPPRNLHADGPAIARMSA